MKTLKILFIALSIVALLFSPAQAKRYGKVYPQGTVSYDTWQKVYENTLSSASSSITISSLTGNTDEVYLLVIRGIDNDTINQWRLRLNDDSTASIYGYQYLIGSNSSIIAGRSTSSYIRVGATNTDGYLTYAVVIIYAKSGYVRTAISNFIGDISGTTVNDIDLFAQSYNETSTEITSITITPANDEMDTGTYVSLYKKISD